MRQNMGRIPKSGEFYRHFKNKLYQIITVAEHSEDGQKLVIYQALYGEFKTYARPLEMFVSEVDHEKYPNVEQKYRFERVELAQEVSGVTVSEVADYIATGTSKETDSADVKNCKVVSSDDRAGELAGALPKVCESEEDADLEAAVEPGLLAFLDTDNWDEKYNILVSLRDKMTDKLIDDFAVVMDVVIPEGAVDARYEQLKICVRTRQKFESQHLR